ncbi:MAG: iron ABC transporter permease [Candidatus Methanomethylophilaceae archaeon]|nr:iron ABC transporter permease [Candidatus Methanomethylophilaceae archaeon]
MVGTDSEETAMIRDYGRYLYRKYVFIIACIIGAIAIAGIATTIGPYDIGFLESYRIMFEHITGNIQDVNKDYVIWEVRLPRIVAGILAGAALAVAGATMQSTMKNPMADPYTTGISAGASFGATLAIVLGFSLVGGNYAIVINAFIFSLIPMAVIMLVSTVRKASPTTIILSGLAVMYLFNAMTTVLMLMADPNALEEAFTWQIGTLGLADWDGITIMAVVSIIGGLILQILAKKINVLTSGDDGARSLGIDADKLRMLCLVVVSLMSAAIVSFTGIIGFVGLVCPHICRMFVGSDNKYLLPSSAAFGGVFLILADLVGRTIISPSVLQVGVITAFIGGPMLLYLLIKRKKEVW